MIRKQYRYRRTKPLLPTTVSWFVIRSISPLVSPLRLLIVVFSRQSHRYWQRCRHSSSSTDSCRYQRRCHHLQLSRNTRLVVVTRGLDPQSSISWAKGRPAIAIVATAVGTDVNANADAGPVVVINVVLSAIPPPVVVVTHSLAPWSSTSWLKERRAIAIVATAVGANADDNPDANAGVVVVVVPPAIPPPIAAVEGVDRLRRVTTVPAQPGIVSSWLELWRMVMSRVKTGYFICFGKLVCGLKKRREKSFRPTKNIGQKLKWFSSRMRWQKSRTEFVFFIVEFLDENCDKKLHPQSEKKNPNDRLLVQTLHRRKGKKTKKHFDHL